MIWLSVTETIACVDQTIITPTERACSQVIALGEGATYDAPGRAAFRAGLQDIIDGEETELTPALREMQAGLDTQNEDRFLIGLLEAERTCA